uniref:Beta-galactosidase n=1 Tax=Nelumbo nucifera TaxID=4432 RepID=A0A822Z801_NELNU|nr:TPA_asm: hypothetical protein HUJ06_013832 [Nelumbo nucifera]
MRMTMAGLRALQLLTAGLVFVCFCLGSLATEVTYDGRAIKINGELSTQHSRGIMWPDLIRKANEGGLDAIETYVFWNVYEPRRRQYDFSGNLDIIRFLKTVQETGLYAVLRIGPYVCAEWNYGGFPVWLHNLPGIQELRIDNPVHMNEMKNFTTLIVDMIKQENLFASQGGPIIIAQIENEYGNVMGPYGDAGKTYINWCANMAESLGIGVPWVMCQQSDAPKPMINTCNGWYCDSFTPNNPNSPKMWTENWTGWFKNWGGADPHRTAEDVAYAVARFFQTGGVFQNYYMYHGGTNFGRTAGGPYIATTYDYDAPLDEYDVSHTDFGNFVGATIYATNETSSCFLSNANTTTDATITFQGKQYTIPAWSVSILPDCKKEVYNTAKISAQTSVMVKKVNAAEDQPMSLKWLWRPEQITETALQGKGPMVASHLMEQKFVTNDASDYLWYMTSVNMDEKDPIWGTDLTLLVNTTGHVLHAYVNGNHIGSQRAEHGGFVFAFEKAIKLKPGRNQISLLSATVGLKNYGAMYDLTPTGILGPVALIGKKTGEEIVKDLSSNKWTFKVGLNGEEKQLYNEDLSHDSEWKSENPPTNRMMTWYKTTFKPPLGTDPVVVDLQGLGKGHAWVNGKSIGRYWPTFLSQQDGCSNTCDYRGPYSDSKCVTNCGHPSQRWYHVPRSFLRDDENTLTLFEEMGGSPYLVNFQTVTVGSVCATVQEGKTLELSCQSGQTISEIRFASFGDPQGTCGSFVKGSCDAKDILSTVQNACVGKESCCIEVSKNALGAPNCGGNITKRLAVEAVC